MDQYGINGQSIAMGNAQRSQVRDLNDRIRSHNKDIAESLTATAATNRTSDQIRDAQAAAQGIWTGSGLPSKVKSFNEWRDGGGASKSNVVANVASTQREGVPSSGEPTSTDTLTTTEYPDVFESDAADALADHSSLSSAASDAVSGAGKVAGGLLSAAAGGVDIYKDIKAGGIAGNNNWEKAGNLLQIGGSIADMAGLIFPPAELIGGVLDLASAATNEVGSAEDESHSSADLKPKISANTVATVATPITQSSIVGNVQ